MAAAIENSANPVVTHNDWPEYTTVPTMQSHPSESDFFGGDIFGGDLIEMYSDATSHDVNGEASTGINLLNSSLQNAQDGTNTLNDEGQPKKANDNESTATSSSFLNDISDILTGKSTSTAASDAVPNAVLSGSADTKQPPLVAPVKKQKSPPSSGKRKASSNLSALASAPNAITRQAAAFKKQQGQKHGKIADGVASASSIVASNIISPFTNAPPPPKDKSIAATPNITHLTNFLQTDSATATAATIAAQATNNVTEVPTNQNRSEADFTAVAQAAVSSLIMSAGKNATIYLTKKDKETSESNKKADTSTAHIAALTSPNWMAACSSTFNVATSNNAANAIEAPAVASEDASDPSKKGSARCNVLSADERAKQNRVRNREHARNTRLRKKAYVEELKRTLTELVTQRDSSEMEQRLISQRDLEQREVRFRVMEEFLKLRGSNEPSVGRWVAILEENFVLTMPCTKYRKMVHPSNCHDDQVLRGAIECMEDARLEKNALDSVTQRDVHIAYDCNRKNFFMDGCTAVLFWKSKIQISKDANDLQQDNSFSNFTFNGSMKSVFSPASNKLVSSNVSFDTGVVRDFISRINPPCSNPNIAHEEHINVSHPSTLCAVPTTLTLTPNEADALLDSIQMPFLTGIPTTTSSNNIQSNAPASISSSEKSDYSSDEKELEEISATENEYNCKHNVHPNSVLSNA